MPFATYLCMNREMSDIARQMGRHRSTPYRELERNSVNGVYRPGLAHELALQRLPHRLDMQILNFALNELFFMGLTKGWSPEHISRQMKKDALPLYVFPKSICRYICRNHSLGLYK